MKVHIYEDKFGPVDVEDTIYHSGDGLEDRMVAQDLLYKFDALLRSERGCGFNLRDRLGLGNSGVTTKPITWKVKKRFRDFYNGIN